MENLLTATKAAIEKSGHTPADIIFIGSMESGHECDWDTFCTLADVEYDDDRGDTKVARDLIIVFSDGSHLRRREYDGVEWWEYIPVFKRPPQSKKIEAIFVTYDDEYDDAEEVELMYTLAGIHKAPGSE